MIRVHVICEGHTEEQFVQDVLAPDFYPKGIFLLPARVGRPGHKGGNFKIERVVDDVNKRLASDKDAYCTTFFDFYGLPESFPGKREVLENSSIETKSRSIIEGLVNALNKQIGEGLMRRFIPYIQMYEFEALLFSDTEAFCNGIGNDQAKQKLAAVVDEFDSPEHINNSVNTAPSKRITAQITGYDKILMGVIGALEIGLPTIRKECRLFDAWLMELEGLKK